MHTLRRHCRIAAVLLACLSVGLHWSALQVVGWMSMVVEFSQTRPVAAALEMTFDGEHPCDLCKLVQSKGPLSEGESQSSTESKSEIKLLAAAIWENPLGWLARSFLITSFPDEPQQASLARERPPVPPPRPAFSTVSAVTLPPLPGAGAVS